MRFPFYALVVAIAICTHATAAPTAWLCNNCSEAQFDSAALARAKSNGQAQGHVWEYDFNQDKLRKYGVEREPAGGGGYTYNVWRVTPTPAEQDHFEAAVDAWLATSHQMKSIVLIDPSSSPPGSPPFPSQVTTFINDATNHQGFYGLATNSQMQGYLSDYAAAWMANHIDSNANAATISMWDFLQMDEQLQYSAIAKNTSLTTLIEIPGGGDASLVMTKDAANKVKFAMVMLTDRNHIDVPIKPEDVAPNSGVSVTYRFNDHPTDIAAFEWYLVHGLNIPVQHISGWTVACTHSAAGIHCVTQPN